LCVRTEFKEIIVFAMSFSYFAVVVFFVMLTFINLNFYNLQLFSFGACVFLAIQQMKISDEAYY